MEMKINIIKMFALLIGLKWIKSWDFDDDWDDDSKYKVPVKSERESDPSERKEFWEETLNARRSNATSSPEEEVRSLFYQKSSEEVKEIIRLVSIFIRQMKYWEKDRRFEKSDVVFYKQFPEPPLGAPDAEVEVECRRGVGECLDHVHSTIQEHYTINSRWGRTIFNLKNNTIESVHIFNFKMTVMYYMCWYTMQEELLLQKLGYSCTDIGIERGVTFLDPALMQDKPFACARHSFCPDFCCGEIYNETAFGRYHGVPAACMKSPKNPCHGLTGVKKESKCIVEGSRNSNIDALIENKINITCECKNEENTWVDAYQSCVDFDECEAELHNCSEEMLCLNTIGSYICVCKWGSIMANNGDDNVTCQKVIDDLGNMEDNIWVEEGETVEKNAFSSNPTARQWLWALLRGAKSTASTADQPQHSVVVLFILNLHVKALY